MDELETLQAQIADMQRKAEELKVQKKAGILAEIKSKMLAYDISSKELDTFDKPTGKVGAPVAIKYRHPEDSTLTWTGRGRQPKFVEAFIANGGTLDDLKV